MDIQPQLFNDFNDNGVIMFTIGVLVCVILYLFVILVFVHQDVKSLTLKINPGWYFTVLKTFLKNELSTPGTIMHKSFERLI